jgi:two-component system response regulator RegX3
MAGMKNTVTRISLNVARSLLEFAGFRADTVQDGKQALEQIRKHTYDLLIFDVIMPGIDGIKLFQMVRKSERYAETPVLFVSGYSSEEGLEAGQREIVDKADGYIQKPFKTRTFLDTVRRLLKK